jgi:hypothetical protein
MVGRDLELTLGSFSIILLSVGACYIYRNMNIEPKPNIPISPINLKITDTNSHKDNDDWWPFIEYTKFDTEDNMYNMWIKTRSN